MNHSQDVYKVVQEWHMEEENMQDWDANLGVRVATLACA